MSLSPIFDTFSCTARQAGLIYNFGQDGTTYGRTNEKETSKDTERWARHMGGHGDNKTRAKKREQVVIAGGGGRRGGGGKQGEGERKKSGGEGDNM